jgi:hypothetical protein
MEIEEAGKGTNAAARRPLPPSCRGLAWGRTGSNRVEADGFDELNVSTADRAGKAVTDRALLNAPLACRARGASLAAARIAAMPEMRPVHQRADRLRASLSALDPADGAAPSRLQRSLDGATRRGEAKR